MKSKLMTPSAMPRSKSHGPRSGSVDALPLAATESSEDVAWSTHTSEMLTEDDDAQAVANLLTFAGINAGTA